MSRGAIRKELGLMIGSASEVRDSGEDEVGKHALGGIGAAVSGVSEVVVGADESRGWGCGSLRLRMCCGLTEGHEEASVAKRCIVFRGTVGLVAEVQVGGLANVLGDVVGSMGG